MVSGEVVSVASKPLLAFYTISEAEGCYWRQPKSHHLTTHHLTPFQHFA
jgi:hypothetical protein